MSRASEPCTDSRLQGRFENRPAPEALATFPGIYIAAGLSRDDWGALHTNHPDLPISDYFLEAMRPLRKSYICHSERAKRPKNLVILISSRSFASLRMTIRAFSQRSRCCKTVFFCHPER
jgi:hypothetical protein